MIAIGSDHAGYPLKEYIKKHLLEKGYEVKDMGTGSPQRVDYPDYAKKVCQSVVSGECENGILFCGTGIGISIAANKIKGIRCGLCSEPFSAALTKQHNNANVIAIGGRTTGCELAAAIVDAYLEAEFMGGDHQRRVDKISALEEDER